jgi:low affinity Fe/Cu permease
MADQEIKLPPDIEAELPAVGPDRESVFLRVADKVSDGMGKPTNILIWLIAVIGWTLLFALSKQLAKGTFLPSWFTSQGYNFPLNLVTTVAELFIGFLVAAATNRVERANDRVMDRIEAMEALLLVEIRNNTELTKAVKDQTDLLADIRQQVAAFHPDGGGHPPEESRPSS